MEPALKDADTAHLKVLLAEEEHLLRRIAQGRPYQRELREVRQLIKRHKWAMIRAATETEAEAAKTSCAYRLCP